MKLIKSGLLFFITTLLLACGSNPPQATVLPTKKINVVSFGGGFNLPAWVAQEQGFFAQQGLDVTLHFTPDSKQLFTKLNLGEYQIAMTAFDNIVAYGEGQGEVKFETVPDFFAFMGSDDGFLSLVATPEIKTVAELKGKTVSVDALSNGFSFALLELLAKNGVKKDDVQWALAGGTDKRFAALMEKQHAATMLRAPFDMLAKNKGFNQLATVSQLGPYMGIVGAARRSWAAQNPATVVAYIRAYRQAVQWLLQPANRAAAEKLLMQKVPTMSAQLATQSCEMMLNPKTGFYADVRLDAQGIANVLAMRSRYAQPARELNQAQKYIDNSYLNQSK